MHMQTGRYDRYLNSLLLAFLRFSSKIQKTPQSKRKNNFFLCTTNTQATMATFMTSNITDSSNNEPPIKQDTASVPSGFVLKLYQMVNEAPDEIIAVRFAFL
jgi:hypothetical protein